jgi:hypothetical protein
MQSPKRQGLRARMNDQASSRARRPPTTRHTTSCGVSAGPSFSGGTFTGLHHRTVAASATVDHPISAARSVCPAFAGFNLVEFADAMALRRSPPVPAKWSA